MTKEKMMNIRGKLLICGVVLLAQASPIAAQAPTGAKVTTAESVQPNSSVSVASYRPPHATGEDFLHNYIGNLGIPIELYPAFPSNAATILLTESAAANLALARPALAQSAAESKMPQSSVSVLVEPQLNDGRLVLRIAAKNFGTNAVAFGPSSVGITKPDGQPVPIYPLSSLVDDVRVAAGLQAATESATAPTQGAYAAPQQTVREGGQLDVTGFTGGSAVGGDEYVRRSTSSKTKPSITAAEAEAQITALKQAILQDSMLGSGQVAAGQIVTGQLKFGKKEDRTLHVRVHVANEEHSFTIDAPQN